MHLLALSSLFCLLFEVHCNERLQHVRTHTRAYTHTHPHMCTHTQESREGVTQRTGESPKATTFTILGLGRCEPGLAAPAPPPLPSPAANGSGNRV